MAKGICGKRCKSCQYRTYFPNPPHYIACYYRGITEQRRPCEAGEGCTVYKKGRPFMEKRPLAVKKQFECVCKMCGTKFISSTRKKYCETCYHKREQMRVVAWNEKKRAEHMAAEQLKDKTCILCGKVYHSPRANKGFCPECKALPRYTRDKLKGELNGV